ncbi:MAG: FHA domain-containing protein [Planctomycetota bacterium]|jgi:pSer/pThr/pTyr-binding forkhead associated (FHA) protein
MNNLIVNLKVLSGDESGTVFRLTGAGAVIGRSPDADIALPAEKSLSRKHARVNISDGKVSVIDLGSQNGVFVADKKTKDAELADGNKLRLGKVLFEVSIEPSQQFEVADRNTMKLAEKPLNEVEQGRGDEPYLPPEEESGRGKGSAVLVLLLVLVILGLYFVEWANTTINRKSSEEFIIKRNEKLVILLPGAAKGFNIESDIKIQNHSELGNVVRPRKFDGLIGTKHTTNVLVVEGKVNGNADIQVYKAGKLLRKYKIFVRGLIARDWDDRALSKDSYRRMAERKLEEARILKAKQAYEASLALAEASELFLRAGEGMRSEKADVEKKDIQRKLSRRIAALYDEARVLIVGAHGVNTDVSAAYEKLAEIKRLVPDQRSIDWQFANIVQDKIKR